MDFDYIPLRLPKNASSSMKKIIGYKRLDHYSAEYLISKMGEDKWNQKFSFAFTRNTWSRIASWYRYSNKSSYPIYKDGFTKWIESGCPHHWEWWHHKNLLPNPLRQIDWLSYQGKICVDYIGRVEDFENDMKKICNKTNLSYKNIHINKTGNGYVKMYNNTMKIVKDLFADEIEMFDYKFGE